MKKYRTLVAINRQGFDVTQLSDKAPRVGDITTDFDVVGTPKGTAYSFTHQGLEWLVMSNDGNRAFRDYDHDMDTIGAVYLETYEGESLEGMELIGFWLDN